MKYGLIGIGKFGGLRDLSSSARDQLAYLDSKSLDPSLDGVTVSEISDLGLF